MRRPIISVLMCLALCFVMTGQRQAQSADGAYRLGPVAFARSGPDAFLAGLGASDFNQSKSARAAAANLEYRFGRKLFVIGPALGLVANLDGGVYGYVGLYADISIGPVVLSPAIAAGGYSQGDSLDLGGVLEFRETVDLSYRFDNGSRLGLRFAHTSNAGIYDLNPGLEEAYVVYSMPLGPLF